MERLSERDKLLYVVFLLVTLALELSGNYWLGVIARVAKTLSIIFYIMNNQGTGFVTNNQQFANLLCTYCCIALLWALVFSLTASLALLILDREREHTGGNSTDYTNSTHT